MLSPCVAVRLHFQCAHHSQGKSDSKDGLPLKHIRVDAFILACFLYPFLCLLLVLPVVNLFALMFSVWGFVELLPSLASNH